MSVTCAVETERLASVTMSHWMKILIGKLCTKTYLWTINIRYFLKLCVKNKALHALHLHVYLIGQKLNYHQ